MCKQGDTVSIQAIPAKVAGRIGGLVMSVHTGGDRALYAVVLWPGRTRLNGSLEVVPDHKLTVDQEGGTDG